MKLTDSIRVHLDEATAEAFRQRARRAGCAPGELLRDIICLQEWGRTWGEHVAHHRRATLSGEGPNAGQGAGLAAASSRAASGSVEDAQRGVGPDVPHGVPHAVHWWR
jgi:hypothetical protein